MNQEILIGTESSLIQLEKRNAKLGWGVLFGFFLFTTAAIMGGAGKFLNVAFPLASLIIGIFLYIKTPIMFMGFSWWMWFISPFVRRLADFRSGFTDPSPILMAPYLVGAITIVTFIKYAPRMSRDGSMTFVLPIIGIMYGFLIGLVYDPRFAVFRELLDWIVPLLMGFHLFANWREFPAFYKNLQQTFVWGILVMGSYGLFQYMTGPEWDVLWLTDTGMVLANGYADKELGAFAIRVFSTMQSGEPFAAFMSAGLLMLLTTKSPIYLPATIVGYVSFLLSLVRSGWIAWFGGLLTLFGFIKQGYQIRLIMGLLTLMLILFPVITMDTFSGDITDRLQTLNNVEDDNSAAGRKDAFQSSIGTALKQVIGVGIGGGARDNTTIAILFALGWSGTFLYVTGLVKAVMQVFTPSPAVDTVITGNIRAVMMTTLIRLPVNASLFGVSGALLWEFAGLGIAAQKYYADQRDQELMYQFSLLDETSSEVAF